MSQDTKPNFRDLFSAHAACYARARPRYPPELFAYLAALAPGRRLAWDCATGNGQAAVGLAEHFDRVVATDASSEQVAHATPHEKIEYRVAPAERPGIPDGCVDLVTVAQALHWLPLDAFYAEVRRVIAPGGILAAWCYGLNFIGPAIDVVVRRFYTEIVGPFWPPGRQYIDEGYVTIPFPFEEIRPTPRFECRAEWTPTEYVDYLRSWSAVQRYMEDRGSDPLEVIEEKFMTAWKHSESARNVTDERRTVRWPIHVRVGRCLRPEGAQGS